MNIWHRPLEGEGFVCSKKDIGPGHTFAAQVIDPHQIQESEANSFAIELLIPEYKLDPYLDTEPDLAKVVDFASDLQCSREAAARRFVEKHQLPLGVAFSKDGRLRYGTSSSEFGKLVLRQGDPMPVLPRPSLTNRLSELETCDPTDWMKGQSNGEVFIQTLHQMDGYAITLIVAEIPDE